MIKKICRRSIALLAVLSLSFAAAAQGQPENDGEITPCAGYAIAACTAPESNTTAPQIGGAVFGGGRKADVTGNSHVAIVNAKEIFAVYGGNDIAGRVQGNNGSIVNIGTTNSQSETFSDGTANYAIGTTSGVIKIGSVYGGGNGYYFYPGIPGFVTDGHETIQPTDATAVLSRELIADGEGNQPGAEDYVITHPVEDELNAGTTYYIPSIIRTQVNVNSDYAYIDSLFGGAKNAFVTNTAGNATTADINIKHGTIYSVFGGNNFGGTIGGGINGNGSITIDITSTKLVSGNTESCLGVTHGIKYLFGGGNKIDAPKVTIYFTGGQIDTAFQGGNSASVGATSTFTVVTGAGNRIFGTNFAGTGSTTTTTTADYPWNAKGGRIATVNSETAYYTCNEDASNIYNIRTLFGGNNAAPMTFVPTLTLTSGGIGTVYGGGNAGDMLGYESLTSVPIDGVFTSDNNPVTYTGYKIGTKVIVNSDDLFVDYIYGGCQRSNVRYGSLVQISAGRIGNVYGGCNISGDVGSYNSFTVENVSYTTIANESSAKNITLTYGTLVNIDGSPVIFGDVYGGSNGYYHSNDFTVYVEKTGCDGDSRSCMESYLGKPIPTANSTITLIDGGTIKGNVYSGGNLANVGFFLSNTRRYNFTNGNISRASSKYYQSLADFDTYKATNFPYMSHHMGSTGNLGTTSLQIVASDVNNPVYIGGNVYGGSNLASTFGISYLLVDGGTSATGLTIHGDVYGGNDKCGQVQYSNDQHNQNPWDGVRKSTDNTVLRYENATSYVKVIGNPRIHAVYGGGNGAYNYPGIDEDNNLGTELAICFDPDKDRPVQWSSYVDINVDNGARIDQVFGGGNGVTVQDSVTVLINANTTGATPVVNTVYGGNNKATMSTVPNIMLTKGVVHDVYGGGNEGNMTGAQKRGDDANNYSDVSTYVLLDNDDINVTGTIYGGAKQANVAGGTFVYVKGGHGNEIFGGNNISGNIGGQTHVVVSGGTVGQLYGGSNGYYDYVANGTDGGGNTLYDAYPFDHSTGDNTIATQTSGVPNCGNTYVLLKGGITEGNIYGGGYAGTCDSTLVQVDKDAILTGESIFGGGRGNDQHIDDCGATRLGAVLGLSRVVLNNMNDEGVVVNGVLKKSTIQKVYGGGNAGDAKNTYVLLNNTCSHPFTYMYAGCNAADVTDTARMVLNGKELKEGSNVINNSTYVFGGNDYGGDVNVSALTINSGTYRNAFGAGNGEYDYTPAQQACDNFPPSNHEVIFTINDISKVTNPNGNFTDSTHFTGYVYGGGNMGLVGDRSIAEGVERFVADADHGTFYKDNTGKYLPIPKSGIPNGITDQNKYRDRYGLIRLNIHGGYFDGRVFAGARGNTVFSHNFFGRGVTSSDKLQLVYGLKMLNMDAGTIKLSLHGGSEFIDDGYYWETHSYTKPASGDVEQGTTMRPSSIVNITGGSVSKSLYGGGFEGNIYGSVYVNIGTEAVSKSYVWTRSYAGDNYAYLQPATDGTDLKEESLKIRDLNLLANVYGGSDWGNAGANAVFSTRGFYGGESYVYVDGKNYLTSNSNGSNRKFMSSIKCIFGSGTSTEGGDVHSKIMFFNFSEHNCLNTDKSMMSFQRADTVMLDHSYITLTGAQDAYFAYPSQNYAICRVRNFIMRDDNMVKFMAPVIYVDTMQSLKAVTTEGNNPTTTYELYANGDDVAARNATGDDCNYDDCTVADYDGSRNIIVINAGNYISVLGYKDSNLNDQDYTNQNKQYGPIMGYFYLATSDNSQVYVYARSKKIANAGSLVNDGFWSTCNTKNVHSNVVDGGLELIWKNADNDEDYRTWRVGDGLGLRKREVTIVANKSPDNYSSNNFWVHDATLPGTPNGDWTDGTGTYHDYAFATGRLDLPPADAGSFYTMASIAVDEENSGEMKLVPAAWNANAGNTDGSWVLGGDNSVLDGRAIQDNPSYTFGLMFTTAGSFNTAPGSTGSQYAVLSGSNVVTYVNGYSTPVVSATSMNHLDFALTYSTAFNRTIIRRVTFTLQEHMPDVESDGETPIDADPATEGIQYSYTQQRLSPIYVTVDIATVINDFSDLNVKALAMYNEGIDHIYGRMVVLPATYEQREVYLTNVQWRSTVKSTTDATKEMFNLVDTTHLNAPYTDPYGYGHPTAKNDNNVFSVTMQAAQSLSDNMSNSTGWYTVAGEESGGEKIMDIRNLYDRKASGADPATAMPVGTQSLTNGAISGGDLTNAQIVSNIKSGEFVGILDGRATAALKLNAYYNGNLLYEKHDEVGLVTLTFGYVGPIQSNGNRSVGSFNVTLKVWTRDKGDTIYLASANEVRRQARDANGNPVGSPIILTGYKNQPNQNEITNKGKVPEYYLNTLAEALDNTVYIDGDVIAILDEVKLRGEDNYVVHGKDSEHEEYGRVQIIRYSGSHYQLPGEYGAYRGPMITLREHAQLTIYNAWLNGSGLTRTKPFHATQDLAQGGNITGFNGGYYYEKNVRVKDTLFASAPMVMVSDAGIFTTMSNVRMNNAVSNVNVVDGDYECQGAALSVYRAKQRVSPSDAQGVITPDLDVLTGTWTTSIMTVTDDTHDNSVRNEVVTISFYDDGTGNMKNTFTNINQPFTYGTQTTTGTPSEKQVVITSGAYSQVFTINTCNSTTLELTGTRVPAEFQNNNHTSSFTATYAAAQYDRNIPKIVLGDKTTIFGNATVNHVMKNSLAASDAARRPGNRGAAVYVHNGYLQIGSNISGNNVYAHDNFYLWEAPRISGTVYYDNRNDGLTASQGSEPTYTWNKTDRKWYNGSTPLNASNIVYTFPDIDIASVTTAVETYEYYKLNFTHFANSNKDTIWNNVFLPRTINPAAANEYQREMKDAQTNHLYFTEMLGKKTRVGISKWFPGGHPSYNKEIRDTIGFGVCTDIPFAEEAMKNGNFVSDSMVFDIDTFYHKFVNPYHIYFHRCATYEYGNGDDIAYHMDDAATCPGGTDAISFRVNRGFLPYTYIWTGYKTKIVDEAGVQRRVVDKNSKKEMRNHTTVATLVDEDGVYFYDDLGNRQVINTEAAAAMDEYLRLQRVDTMYMTNVLLPVGTLQDYYYYTVEATDLAGCRKNKDALVKIVKTNATSYTDSENFLQKRAAGQVYDYSFSNPGIDSNYRRVDNQNDSYTIIFSNPENSETNTDTNQYLRTYRAYQLFADVKPTTDYGSVYWVTNENLQNVYTAVAGGTVSPGQAYHTYTIPTDGGHAIGKIENPVLLCEGDVVNLYTKSVDVNNGGSPDGIPDYEFLYWNFDPAAPQATQYTMPGRDATVAAYYGPKDYWYQVVTSDPGTGHYEVDYHGNVTIKDEQGLAWFISTVNGLNFQTAQTFVFDTVKLTAAEYDMKAHKWTPLGNINSPFMGTIYSTVEGGSTIQGVFCNEEQIPYVGLFGKLKGARINPPGVSMDGSGNTTTTEHGNITIANSFFTGNNYAGGISAWAEPDPVRHQRTTVNNVVLKNITVAATNSVGGAFGYAEGVDFTKNVLGHAPDANTVTTSPSDAITFLGSSVYLGGIFGQSKNVTVLNNVVQPIDATNSNSLYYGGFTARNLSGDSFKNLQRFFRRLSGSKSSSASSRFINNYVEMQTADNAFRVGGMVGDGTDILLRNNYAYGDIAASNLSSSLIAMCGNGVTLDHCYYRSNMGHATSVLGNVDGSTTVNDTSAFTGTGSQVIMDTRVDGISHATVLLNKFVREHGGDSLLTWRSDLKGVNNGLPLFGTPDTVPIYVDQYENACDTFGWENRQLTESGRYQMNYFNGTLLTDSIITLYLNVHNSVRIEVSDTMTLGRGYEGHGFKLNASEILPKIGYDSQSEVRIFQVVDSLLTENGCDSIVILTLTVYNDNVGIETPDDSSEVNTGSVKGFEVQVYPNPTSGNVTVESDATLKNVEVYDNISRRLMSTSANGNKAQLNLDRFAAGAYYIRVTTTQGVAVKKVIKR